MKSLGTTLEKTARNVQRVSSANDTAIAPRVETTRERHGAIKMLIDRAALSGLLSSPEHDVLEAMAFEWNRHLSRQHVPLAAFETLYESAVEIRIQRRSESGKSGG